MNLCGSIRLRSKRQKRPLIGSTTKQRSRRAAERFLDEIDAALDQISRNPEQFTSCYFGTRRNGDAALSLRIIFRDTAVRVEIIAIAYGRRWPGYWYDRLE